MPQDQPQPVGVQERQFEEQVFAGLDQPEAVRFADQLCIPRFRVIHRLIWGAVTAVLLTIELTLWSDDSLGTRSLAYFWVTMVSTILRSIVAAAGLVGAGVLIRAKCHTMPRRLQPGHWLVLVGALETLLGLVVWAAIRLVFGGDWRAAGEVRFLVWSAGTGLCSAVLAVAFVLAAIWLRDAWRWKIIFGVIALVEAAAAAAMLSFTLRQLGDHLSFLQEITSSFATYRPAFILILLVAAVVLDLPRRGSRDWVHWLGVFCLGFGCAMTIVSRIVFALFVRFL